MNERRALLRGKLVDFVKHAQGRAVGNAQLLQNLVDFLVQLCAMRVGDVADAQNERGFLDLFQSSAKRGEQPLGKVADESHGVGNEHAAIRWEAQSADGGIERGE